LGVSNARLTQTRKTLAVSKPVDINFDKLSTFFPTGDRFADTQSTQKAQTSLFTCGLRFLGQTETN
jgi:hypothetical protein